MARETGGQRTRLPQQRRETLLPLTFAYIVDVDVDWMDPKYVKNMPIKPHDQTSNQLWVNIELHRASKAQLLHQTARDLKDKGWLAVYTRVVGLPRGELLDSPVDMMHRLF